MAFPRKPAYAVRRPGLDIPGRRLFAPLTEQAGSVWDVVGGARGTASGDVLRRAGDFGTCLLFNSTTTTGVVDFGSDSRLDDLGPLTVAAWIRPRSTGQSQAGRIMDKGGSNVSGWQFYTASAGPFAVGFTRGYATTNLACTSTLTAPLETWHRVAVSWDGTAFRSGVTFYIDGRPTPTTGGTDGSGAIKSDAANNLLVGNRSPLDRHFDGRIDAPAIWNRVLGPAELMADYRDAWAGWRPRKSVPLLLLAASLPPPPKFYPGLNPGM